MWLSALNFIVSNNHLVKINESGFMIANELKKIDSKDEESLKAFILKDRDQNITDSVSNTAVVKVTDAIKNRNIPRIVRCVRNLNFVRYS